MNPVKRGARLAICIAGAAGIALLALQLALLWAVSDGWSGIRASLPLLGAGALLSALACAGAVWPPGSARTAGGGARTKSCGRSSSC